MDNNKPYTRYFEMAMERRALSLRISFIEPEIHAQILKLHLFPYSVDVPHWSEKFRGHCIYIHHKLKQTHKYPEADFYYRFLTNSLDDADYYANRKSAIENKYRTSVPYKFPNHAEFEIFLKAQMRILSEYLSRYNTSDMLIMVNAFIESVLRDQASSG